MLTVKYATTMSGELQYNVICGDKVVERETAEYHLVDIYRYPTGICGGVGTVCDTITLGKVGEISTHSVFVENMAGKTVQKFSSRS